MKINSEKAYDMLPFVIEIYDKIDKKGIEKDMEKIRKEAKGKDVKVEELGMEALLKVIKRNAPRIKEEVFNIVAIASEKTVKEAKAQTIKETWEVVQAIFNDPELISFFKLAMN